MQTARPKSVSRQIKRGHLMVHTMFNGTFLLRRVRNNGIGKRSPGFIFGDKTKEKFIVA